MKNSNNDIYPFLSNFFTVIVGILCLVLLVALAQAYSLPREPKVVHETKDYYGEYNGPEYTFTLDENGFQIRYAHEAKWTILNNTLFVDFFDEDGNKVERKKFGFIEQDGWYEIHTNKHLYKKYRE